MIHWTDYWKECQKLVGVPYHHQGRSTAGLDCAGTVILPAEACGIKVEAPTNYATTPTSREMQDIIETYCTPIAGEYRPLEIWALWFGNPRLPQHLAAFSSGYVIHACNKRKKVIQHRVPPTWYRQLMARYTVNGIDLG
jgi:hypothetical protein